MFIAVIVGLNKTSYYVDEETGIVTVCAEVMEHKIDCPVGFPFNVKIQTFDDSSGIIDNCQYCLMDMLYCCVNVSLVQDLMIILQ